MVHAELGQRVKQHT